MKTLVVTILAIAGCGDSFGGKGTPEQVVDGASEGQHVDVTGTVFAVTWDSLQSAARRQELVGHEGDIDFVIENDAEESRGITPAFDEPGADYPRTDDHYILIRTTKPPGVSQDEPGFSPGSLAAAWGLGIHVTSIDPAKPLPEIGAQLHVTGTFHTIVWNNREVKVPIVDDAAIEVLSAPPDLAGPGAACTLDQDCNARLICDRTSRTCSSPPREIYWGDPWHDVNGACDTDADCPLGQVCDASYSMATTGDYAVHYFIPQDMGRHLCTLDPTLRSVAAQCPRIYTMRDLVGARFVTGKEICVRGKLLNPVPAEDHDTHDQMRVDEPIPYPTADIAYHLFGATTENGPVYKDPAVPGGAVTDPVVDQDVVVIGTYRYDPDHGWHEVHPVKAYLAPP
jgi:hypothetical protein